MNRRELLLDLAAVSTGLMTGCTTLAEPSPAALFVPALAFDLNQVLVSGQSLAAGALGVPALSTTQTRGNLMFNVGARLVASGDSAPVNAAIDLASLVPLVEQDSGSAGETICSAFANRLATRLPGKRMLLSVNGANGKPYSELERGSVPYANGLAAIKAAQSLHAGAGFASCGVSAILLVHGESDEAQDNTSYAADLLTWITDYNRDLRAITGQSMRVPMLQSQLASGWPDSTGKHNSIPQQQLDASKAYPGLLPMVCPKYMLPYHSGNIHMAPEGYRWLGEYYARVFEWMLAGTVWHPVSPSNIALNSARTQLVVNFYVPVPPLVLDTQLVTEPTSIAGQKYGFEVYDTSGSPPAVLSVTSYGTDGTSLLIALSGPLVSGARLRYAYSRPEQSGHPGVAGPTGDFAGNRGNLRDSDPSSSLYGNTLYNWCITFDYPIG